MSLLVGGASEDPGGEYPHFLILEVGLRRHGHGAIHARAARLDARGHLGQRVCLALVLGGHVFVRRAHQLLVHGVANKIVGPGFNEIATKHKGRADLEAYLVGKIKNGGSGVYGAIPMPAQPQVKDADAQAIARWIASGAK